jgi:hypothetical protein
MRDEICRVICGTPESVLRNGKEQKASRRSQPYVVASSSLVSRCSHLVSLRRLCQCYGNPSHQRLRSLSPRGVHLKESQYDEPYAAWIDRASFPSTLHDELDVAANGVQKSQGAHWGECLIVKMRKWSSDDVACRLRITCFAAFAKTKSSEPWECCCPESIFERLNLSEKFTKQKRNVPTGRDGTQTA